MIDGGANAPEIYLSPILAGSQVEKPTQTIVLLRPGVSVDSAIASLSSELGSDVRVAETQEWFGSQKTEQDRLNRLVLFVLAGPGTIYALIALANILVMSYSLRGHEVATMRLLGIRRTPADCCVHREFAPPRNGRSGPASETISTRPQGLASEMLRYISTICRRARE